VAEKKAKAKDTHGNVIARHAHVLLSMFLTTSLDLSQRRVRLLVIADAGAYNSGSWLSQIQRRSLEISTQAADMNPSSAVAVQSIQPSWAIGYKRRSRCFDKPCESDQMHVASTWQQKTKKFWPFHVLHQTTWYHVYAQAILLHKTTLPYTVV